MAYVRVRDRPRPATHPGTGAWDYVHWRYGKRFWRGCRVRVKPGPGMDLYTDKTGVVIGCAMHMHVRFIELPKSRRYCFHPMDLDIMEDQP